MKMYSLKEFAEVLRFHPETVRKAAKEGKCGRMILGEWRFTDEDIERISEWPCGKETASTTSTFKSVESEYDKLLAQATGS